MMSRIDNVKIPDCQSYKVLYDKHLSSRSAQGSQLRELKAPSFRVLLAFYPQAGDRLLRSAMAFA